MSTFSISELTKLHPRVEACIEAVMRRFPGASSSSQARYFEEVHQHLAPLARRLEVELNEARAEIEKARASSSTLWQQLLAHRRTDNTHAEARKKALSVATASLEPSRKLEGEEETERLRKALKEVTSILCDAAPAPLGQPERDTVHL